MDSTGYDNIFIRGLFLGMSKAELKKKADAIADFSELGDFLDLPMRTYSSGMRARLAFAISTHVETDILLLDEVVATGDARFLKKANDKLESFARESKVLVLASHSNKVLRDLCNKAVLLEHGRIKAFGDLEEVIETYSASAGVDSRDG
jgi:ABC-type polysaccharide/polyol phosphate transport system ATPase subunit